MVDTDEIIPVCPTCGYDLRGTPGNRCSECGATFDRAAVFSSAGLRAPEPVRAHGWLLLAIMFGLMGWSFAPPHAQLKQLAYIGVMWLLTVTWVALLRRSILGDRPWLALWVVLIAVMTPNRYNIEPPVWQMLVGWSVGISAAVVAFVLLRRPMSVVRAGLYVVAAWCVLVALAAFISAGLSAFRGMPGGEYRFYGVTLPAGGTNDALAAAVGVMHLVAAVVAYMVARRLRPAAATGDAG